MELNDRLNQRSSGGAARTLELRHKMAPSPYFCGVCELTNGLEEAK
jgi:hypothetical protein